MSSAAGPSRPVGPAGSSPFTSINPPIVQGANLLLAWRVEGRNVLLIGGGVVAASRLYFLLESGAHVTIISPRLDPSIEYRLQHSASQITHLARPYEGRQDAVKVEDFFMVFTAIDDVDLSRQVSEMCRERRVNVNVADIPPMCDFYFGAQLRRGPLQVLISTGGMGPKIGVMVRDTIINALPERVEEAIEGVGALRADLRKRAPGTGGELGKKRMEWMIKTCDAWGLAEMEHLRDEGVRRRVLDNGWDKGKVVGPAEAGARKQKKRPSGERKGAWEMVDSFVDLQAVSTGLVGVGVGTVIGACIMFGIMRAR